MIYTTDDLITSVKTRALVPSSQSTFSDTDIITFLNEEMYISLVPDIMKMREDFFKTSISIDLVANISKYKVPERAIGNVLVDVLHVDSSNTRRSIPRVSMQDLNLQSSSAGYPFGYILEGDYIKLLPTASSSAGTLEVWYYQRPSQLVLAEECALITSVTAGVEETALGVATDVSSTIGDTVDFVNGQSPMVLLAKDCGVHAASATEIVVTDTDLFDEDGSTTVVGVGDYICPQYKSLYPMIPQEFHPVLAQMVAARLCEAMGDLEKLQAVNGKLVEMRKAVMGVIANRVDASPKKIVNRYSIRNHFGRRMRSVRVY